MQEYRYAIVYKRGKNQDKKYETEKEIYNGIINRIPFTVNNKFIQINL